MVSKSIMAFCGAIIIALATAPQVSAQDSVRPDHVHPGTMNAPSGESHDVIYEMFSTTDGVIGWFKITGNGQAFRFGMKDLRFDERGLTFHWFPPGGDETVDCELVPDGAGSWAGECTDDQGGHPGRMTMGPRLDAAQEED